MLCETGEVSVRETSRLWTGVRDGGGGVEPQWKVRRVNHSSLRSKVNPLTTRTKLVRYSY